MKRGGIKSRGAGGAALTQIFQQIQKIDSEVLLHVHVHLHILVHKLVHSLAHIFIHVLVLYLCFSHIHIQCRTPSHVRPCNSAHTPTGTPTHTHTSQVNTLKMIN